VVPDARTTLTRSTRADGTYPSLAYSRGLIPTCSRKSRPVENGTVYYADAQNLNAINAAGPHSLRGFLDRVIPPSRS
jgi:hypothetical protein